MALQIREMQNSVNDKNWWRCQNKNVNWYVIIRSGRRLSRIPEWFLAVSQDTNLSNTINSSGI